MVALLKLLYYCISCGPAPGDDFRTPYVLVDGEKEHSICCQDIAGSLLSESFVLG